MNVDFRRLALIAAISGGVAVIGLFLPWFRSSMDLSGFEMPTPEDQLWVSGSSNAFTPPFQGVWIFVLCLIGIGTASCAAAGRTDLLPFAGRQNLMVGALLFGLATLLVLLDFTRHLGGGEREIETVAVTGGRAIGLTITFLAALVSTTALAVGALRRFEADTGL